MSKDKEQDNHAKIAEQSLLQLWSVVNELSKIREPSKYYRVSVFGSARIKPGQTLYQEVKTLAARLAGMGCDIVTGGGPGLMQAANEGENVGDQKGRTRSIGVTIELPFEDDANPFVEKVYTHQTFFTRLHQFVRLSNAFVVVGGGIGTTLETLMVWQLLQVNHLQNVPLILVGDMWKELVEWARRTMLVEPTALASAKDIDIPICVPTVDGCIEALTPHIEAFKASREK